MAIRCKLHNFLDFYSTTRDLQEVSSQSYAAALQAFLWNWSSFLLGTWYRGCAKGSGAWNESRDLVWWCIRELPSLGAFVWHHDLSRSLDGHYQTRYQQTGSRGTHEVLLWRNGAYSFRKGLTLKCSWTVRIVCTHTYGRFLKELVQVFILISVVQKIPNYHTFLLPTSSVRSYIHLSVRLSVYLSIHLPNLTIKLTLRLLE